MEKEEGGHSGVTLGDKHQNWGWIKKWEEEEKWASWLNDKEALRKEKRSLREKVLEEKQTNIGKTP